MRSRAVHLIVMLLMTCGGGVTGCGRSALTPLDYAPDHDQRVPVDSWGGFFAGLDIPDCGVSSYPDLIVDDLTSELDGGDSLDDPEAAGPTLSFIEAMHIAGKRSGYDVIRFDAGLFPAAAPATIALTPPAVFQMNQQDFCLDGRGRGVVVRWSPDYVDSEACSRCMFGINSGSLVVGITFEDYPDTFHIGNAQMAGCRLLPRHGAVELYTGGILGPGNELSTALAHPSWSNSVAVMFDDPGRHIVGNYFDYDPIARRFNTPGSANVYFLIWGSVRIDGNVFNDFRFSGIVETGLVEMVGNWVGTDSFGAVPPETVGGLTNMTGGEWIIGPGNVVRNGGAVETGEIDSFNLRVTITENSISGTTSGILCPASNCRVDPPTVDAIASNDGSQLSVSGTCPVEGEVELFRDPAAQGELFLTRTSCTLADGFSATVTDAGAGNITATLTTTEGTSPFSAPVSIP